MSGLHEDRLAGIRKAIEQRRGKASNVLLEALDEKMKSIDSAYEIAKAGGKHAGFYRNNLALPEAMLRRGIRSMGKRIDEHQEWIANPYGKLPNDMDYREVTYLVSKKWPRDIARIEEEMSILKGILKDLVNSK